MAHATIDHETIRTWVEDRGGCPSHVKGTGTDGDPGIIRIDYTGFAGETSLEKISWETFFDAFEDNELAFLYDDSDDSRFSKLVSRDSVELEGGGEDASERSKQKKGESQDAIGLLQSQHREVERLFDEIQGSEDDDEIEALFAELANALAAHNKIEETIFYPAVFDDETEDELRESVEEHLVAKRLIADLLDMEPSDPQYMAKMTVLEEVVAHHVEEEEDELFEQVRRRSQDDLEVLGRQMKKRYQELMEDDPAENVPAETGQAGARF